MAEEAEPAKGNKIRIFAGSWALFDAWIQGGETWHKEEGATTAPVVIKLKNGKGYYKTTIWKTSFEEIEDPDAKPSCFSEAVLDQRPQIKKNLVTATRQMAQCKGAENHKEDMVNMMVTHFEDALKLQHDRGAGAIWRMIEYDDSDNSSTFAMIASVVNDVAAETRNFAEFQEQLTETTGHFLTAMDTNKNKRSASTLEA